jgi:hypothetical protein
MTRIFAGSIRAAGVLGRIGTDENGPQCQLRAISDQVLILTGPDKGKTVEVCEITVGQGGWELARLNLGEERSQKFRDIFEEYSLLKIKDKLQTASSPA